VTAKLTSELVDHDESGSQAKHLWRLTNTSNDVVDTHLLVILDGLPAGVRLLNASGSTKSGQPYLRVFLRDGMLNPGESVSEPLVFSQGRKSPPPAYTLELLSGQGAP
jgi:hypothetical protein